MTTFEIIKKLAKKQGKSLNRIEEELGWSRNTLYSLKINKPSSERLETLADYFNVSVDYLLGREEKPKYTSDDLEEMIDNAMSFNGKPLSDHDREVARAYLEGKFGTK